MTISSTSESASSASAWPCCRASAALAGRLFASLSKFSRALLRSWSYSPAIENRGKFSKILGKIPSPRKRTVSGSKCATCNNISGSTYRLYAKTGKMIWRFSNMNCDIVSVAFKIVTLKLHSMPRPGVKPATSLQVRRQTHYLTMPT